VSEIHQDRELGGASGHSVEEEIAGATALARHGSRIGQLIGGGGGGGGGVWGGVGRKSGTTKGGRVIRGREGETLDRKRL